MKGIWHFLFWHLSFFRIVSDFFSIRPQIVRRMRILFICTKLFKHKKMLTFFFFQWKWFNFIDSQKKKLNRIPIPKQKKKKYCETIIWKACMLVFVHDTSMCILMSFYVLTYSLNHWFPICVSIRKSSLADILHAPLFCNVSP